MSKENNINNSNKNEGNDESLWGLPLSSSFAKYTYVYNKDEILSFNTNRKFEPPEALVSSKLYSPEVLIPVNQDATQLDDYEKALEGTGKWASFNNVQRGKPWSKGGGRGRGKLSTSENSVPFTGNRGKSDTRWGKKSNDGNPSRNDETTPPSTPPSNLRSSSDQVTPPPGLNTVNWHYKDEQGVIQGPFKSEKMNEWYFAKFLPLDLMVKRTNQNDFYPLSHLVNENPASPFHLSFSSVVTNNNPKSSSVISQNLKKEDPVITPEFAKLLGIDSNSVPVSATPTSIPLNVPNSNVANPPFASFKNSSGGFPISNFNYGNSFAQPTIDPSLLFYSNQMPVPMNPAFNLMDPLQLQAQLQLQMQLQQQYQNVPIHPQYFNDPQFVIQSQLLQNQLQNQNILQTQIPIPNLQMQIPVQNQNLNQFQQPIHQSAQVQIQQSGQPISPADQRNFPQQQQKEVQSQQPAPPSPSPSALSSSSENNQNKGQPQPPSQSQSQSRSAKKKKNKKAKQSTNNSPNSPAKSNDNFPTIIEPSFPSPVKPSLPSSSPAPSPSSPAPSLAPSSVQSPEESSQWPALSSKKQSKKEKATVQAANKVPSSSSAAPKSTPWSNIVAKPDNINDNNQKSGQSSGASAGSNAAVKANSLSSSSSSLSNSAPKQANKLNNSSGNNNNNNNNNSNNKVDKKSAMEDPSWIATVIPPRSVQEIQKEELEQKKKQKAQEKLQRNIAESENNNQKKLSVASSPWATVLSPEPPSKVLFSDIQHTDKILSKVEKEERKKIISYQQQVEETKKASPWKTPVATVTKSKTKSLFEIQQEEKRLLEQQQEIERNLQLQQAATMGTISATSTSTSWAKKLVPPPSSRPKSLREIQEEELLTRKVQPQKGASNAPVGWKTVWNNNPVDSNNINNINNAPSTPPKAADEDVQSDQSVADLLWAQNSNSNKKPTMGAWSNKLGGSSAQSQESNNIVNNNDNDDDDDDDELFWGAPVPTPSPAPSSSANNSKANNNNSNNNNNNNNNSNKGKSNNSNNNNNNQQSSGRGRGKRRN